MRTIKCALAASILTLGLAATAAASPVTVGSPLTGAFLTGSVSINATAFNFALSAPGAHAASPVDGVIVRWNLLGAKGGPFSLRVLRPAGGISYTGAGTSAPVGTTTTGLESFPTAIPIKAGEAVAVDAPAGSELGVQFNPASGIAFWSPPLAEGSTQPYKEPSSGAEYGFNAVVQPQPTVTGVGPASGSFKGGSAVSISGADFAGVSAVRFGPNAAVSFAVGSENQITAVAPPGTRGGVDVVVTTIAGSSPITATDRFTYTACIVPKLNAKKLKAAKKRLKKAGCKVGKVIREDGVSAKAGKVVAQSRKPGRQLPPGAKVNVTLG